MCIVGHNINNKNRVTYTIICQYNDNAILLGGNDYVVITDLSNFKQFGFWDGGTYFPHFHSKENYLDSFDKALNYFKLICNNEVKESYLNANE